MGITTLAVVCLGCGSKPPPASSPGKPAPTGKLQEDVTERKVLHGKELPECEGKEEILIVATMPARSTSGRHTHPGPELAYVLEGEIDLVNDGEMPRRIRKGETLATVAGKPHVVNNEGTVPAKLVVFMVTPKGAPLATPVK
jgi:quercetin dioxygenase-like cupin family protein